MTKPIDKNVTSPTLLPHLPTTLPFDNQQKQWLAGFFAGLHSRLLVQQDSSSNTAASTTVAAKPLTIIYGTQTGNAESVAELAAEQAVAQGMQAVVLDMDNVDVAQLSSTERLLIVTSTYGEGEMPDNAQALWDAIEADDAPRLEDTFYSVLALGDTSYDGFCVAGKMWDERLVELGAQRINPRVDCDIDFEDAAQEWLDQALPEIAKHGSHDHQTVAQSSGATSSSKVKSAYNRKNPLEAILTKKSVLTGEDSSKEICHFEFSLAGSGERYNAGDALNIIALNRPDLIQEIVAHFAVDEDMVPTGYDKPLQQILREDLEVRTPSRELVAMLAQLSADEDLNRFLENNDPEAIADFLWGKDVVSLLKLYGKANLSVEQFLSLCKPLAPRAYSISSSIKKHDNEVHLTIGSVRYQYDGRNQNGVCSTFLADVVDEGSPVHCYFSPNKNFAVPSDPTLPMIMVGPGTGLAPFRAFLEEREMTNAPGDNWLFFGDRNSSSDYIYESEVSEWQESGLLTKLDLAFSRDQKEKIYVQHRMLEKGAELFAWLERGGYFYICGDAFRMAKDVDAALHTLIAEHGNFSEQEAIDYVGNLKKEKRYVRDVY